MDLGRYEEADYPAFTMSQAAQLLRVLPSFLRSLDGAGVLNPSRSPGGHRRYTRQQLAVALRARELVDEGMTVAAVRRILRLEDELAAAHAEIDRLRRTADGDGVTGDRGPAGPAR